MTFKPYHIILLFVLTIMHNRTIAQPPTTDTIEWKIAAELPSVNGQAKALGVAGPVVGVTNNRLIVGGGANFPNGMPWLGGKKKYYDDVYVFEKNAKGSIQLYPKTFHLPDAVAYSANVSTPQGIVVAGGENENGLSNKVFLLQWNTAKNDIAVKELPHLPMPVTNASITADESIIYLAGGESTNGVSDQFYCLDIQNTAAGWQTLPALPKPISHAVMVVQSDAKDKGIYIIGGRKRNSNGISDLYATIYRFDLKNKKWNEKQSLPYALSAGTGIAVGSHCILLFGGDKGETFHKTEELIAAINAEKDEAKKQQLIDEKAALQASHPGFSNQVLQYNTITNKWDAISTIPFAVPATTTAVKWSNEVVIPSGEIRAGVRTPQILVREMMKD